MHIIKKLLLFVIPICVVFYMLNWNKKNGAISQLISSCPAINEADYVIVGVGTSGAVIAKILSDDANNSVIALHNGPYLPNDPMLRQLQNASDLIASGMFDESPYYISGLTTEQQGAYKRKLTWLLGNSLGGGSTVNGAAYCRSTDAFHEQWAKIAGNDWSVKHMHSLYKELETYVGFTTNPPARGTHGPLTVYQVPCYTESSTKFTRAIMHATQLPFVLDYNDPNTFLGASSQMQYNQLPDKIRQNSVSAFLQTNTHEKNPKKRNLCILTNAIASRILWDNNKAVGVEYKRDGKLLTVKAKKEVIICAGLMSSSLLMHSGIGDAALLESLKIPVVYDNPNVGKNLIDHAGLILFFSSNPKDASTLCSQGNPTFNQIAWLSNPVTNQQQRIANFVTTHQTNDLVLALLTLTNIKSRGSITIDSNDPFKAPIINLGILSNEADVEQFYALMHHTIQKMTQNLGIIDSHYKLLSPNSAILNDKEKVIEYIKNIIENSQHFHGHCKMAPLKQHGVVDSQGRVYGTQNVRVADCSIIPFSVDGAPLAVAYVIGLNIGRAILDEQKKIH